MFLKKVDVSKNVCDGERHFFRNEGGKYSLVCISIDILLNCYEFGFDLKYCTPYPLWKLVKIW